MNELREILKTQENSLNQMQAILKRRLSKAPAGSVRVTTSHGRYNQYTYINGEEKRYLKKNELDLARRLVQKKYDEDALKIITKLQASQKNFLSSYDYSKIDNLYYSLCPERKALVTPLISDIDDYVKEWLEKNPGFQNTFPRDPQTESKTKRGEYVKSKSEKIIADMLYDLGIPYQYEPRILIDGKWKYPDFIVLNKRTRRSYYWEHFGKLSQDDYSDKNWEKISRYEANGLTIGVDVIITTEKKVNVLDVDLVKRKIKQYLL